MPDLRPWARTIAHFLKPGGVFYMVEMHPFADVFDDTDNVTDLHVGFPYFHQEEPLVWQAAGTYADRSAVVQNKTSNLWSHGLGEIVTVLLASAVPVNVGVVSLVSFDPGVPLSEAAARTGVDGAAGGVVSMIRVSAPEAALTLPAVFVSVAVTLYVPSASLLVVTE